MGVLGDARGDYTPGDVSTDNISPWFAESCDLLRGTCTHELHKIPPALSIRS